MENSNFELLNGKVIKYSRVIPPGKYLVRFEDDFIDVISAPQLRALALKESSNTNNLITIHGRPYEKFQVWGQSIQDLNIRKVHY